MLITADPDAKCKTEMTALYYSNYAVNKMRTPLYTGHFTAFKVLISVYERTADF